MSHNFDNVINHQNTNSLKHDCAQLRGKPEGLLPMWVADMDFAAPPEVLSVMEQTARHGVFGYAEPMEGYYAAVSNWFGSRVHYHAEAADILPGPGVVFALVQCIRALTEPGETVLLQTPVYAPLFSIIKNNDRRLVTNPLIHEAGSYRIDFDDFEQKIRENSVKLFILVNPHNPVGRVFTRTELEQMNEICLRHDVLVVSDEIHCDFVWPGHEHICFGRINEKAIITTAPTKTFNIAGLQIANTLVKDPALRTLLKNETQKSGYENYSRFGIAACQAAYEAGGEWLIALNEYLFDNICYVRDFLAERLPNIRLAAPEGTYLMWLDFSAYGLSSDELNRRMVEKARLWLTSGHVFGDGGASFMRLNIACPRATLEEGLRRLERGFAIKHLPPPPLHAKL